MKRFDLMLASAWCLLGLAVAAPVRADDAPGFDRPGIAFGTDTLSRGGIAWEQGLPDASWDDSEGVRTRTWVADTLLRFGLAETVELQLGADSYGGVRRRGLGARTSQHGGGDGRLSLKWVPTTGGDAFSVGVLATASLPYGQAPVGDGGHVYDLGITAAWDLRNDAVGQLVRVNGDLSLTHLGAPIGLARGVAVLRGLLTDRKSLMAPLSATACDPELQDGLRERNERRRWLLRSADFGRSGAVTGDGCGAARFAKTPSKAAAFVGDDPRAE